MDNSQFETRTITVEDFSVETRADGPPKLVGYAVRYGALSQDLGGFRERFAQHAFAESIANGPDVLALAQHDDQKILGRRSAGTLRIEDDAFGVRFEIDPPNTTYAADLLESIRRRDITGMSFGFTTDNDHYIREGGETIREVRGAKLFEVSVVTSPAYLQSGVKIRSEALAKAEELNKPEAVEPASPPISLLEKIQNNAEKSLAV